LKRYSFAYRKETSKIKEEIHRPVASVYLRGRDNDWYLFYPYVDSGADISLFTRTDCELLGYELEDGHEHLVAKLLA